MGNLFAHIPFGDELKDFALPAGEFLAFRWSVTGPRLKIFDHASSETGRFVGAAVPHLLNRVEKFFGDLLTVPLARRDTLPSRLEETA